MSLLLDVGTTEAPPATLASRQSRLLAFAIDAALYLVASRPVLRTALSVGSVGAVSLVAAIWVLAVGITQIMLLGLRGQTVGKRITKIAVVDQYSTDLVGYVRVALVRQGPQGILSLFFPTLGSVYLIVDGLFIFSKKRRCLHDLLAGTVVIRVSADWPQQPARSAEGVSL